MEASLISVPLHLGEAGECAGRGGRYVIMSTELTDRQRLACVHVRVCVCIYPHRTVSSHCSLGPIKKKSNHERTQTVTIFALFTYLEESATNQQIIIMTIFLIFYSLEN